MEDERHEAAMQSALAEEGDCKLPGTLITGKANGSLDTVSPVAAALPAREKSPRLPADSKVPPVVESAVSTQRAIPTLRFSVSQEVEVLLDGVWLRGTVIQGYHHRHDDSEEVCAYLVFLDQMEQTVSVVVDSDRFIRVPRQAQTAASASGDPAMQGKEKEKRKETGKKKRMWDVIRSEGFEVVRHSRHFFLERLGPDGKRETMTVSKTASDRRARKNIVSQLRKAAGSRG